MSAVDHIYEISLFNDDKPKNISKQEYGSLVNCIALKATISYIGDIDKNTVRLGVENASSGWTASSLQTALNSYPPLSQYIIKVKD
jgi:hypothetical protein